MWKGNKARNFRAVFKLYNHVWIGRETEKNVEEVKRVSDNVMSMKLEIEGVMMNVSGYTPQVGCWMEEKERF